MILPAWIEVDSGHKVDALTIEGTDPQSVDLSVFAEVLEETATAAGIDSFDMTPPLAKMAENGELIVLATDAHYNRQAHRVVGEWLAKLLEERLAPDSSGTEENAISGAQAEHPASVPAR